MQSKCRPGKAILSIFLIIFCENNTCFVYINDIREVEIENR